MREIVVACWARRTIDHLNDCRLLEFRLFVGVALKRFSRLKTIFLRAENQEEIVERWRQFFYSQVVP